ncbi:MAG: helix-turn-helix domain-containing protein [Desulfuromonadaceae bacterium]|nr:helix-turn-helix domain-containing protein [Desulfuromonadaceae bacterium]MDD2847919.1 helix-turn-helix domain-containing protein [Desulfuromonadaceae bacterium]MDD4131339.1 helix-turn-helix domain-containing protein [Desulfuromonadaceae bacterium]
MIDYRTPEEWEEVLGQQIRNLRILRNMDQQDLSKQAGVALNVIKRIESGKTSTTKSLIKILRVLNRVEWLETLAPKVTVNPLQMTPLKTPRKKVFKPRPRKLKLKEELLLPDHSE